ncbi:hypothetical protein [Sphingomonas sp. 35-24ZXX]|uniref:hypothetical protein n=1 Tax=Sphingomonas sp. 35-24ZXX TaxID=1545915 RepID=UPI000A4F98AE|nr:hypothetical protein [Sphingomonas sp. 35-24ZXX]
MVNTNTTTVRVDAGATVSATVRPAILIDIPLSQPAFRTSTVTVNGNVLGGSQSGIGAFSGTPVSSPTFSGNELRLALTVSRGASVTGQTGVLLGTSSGNIFGRAIATVDNAGTITGSSGIALASQNSNLAYFESVTNRSTGLIGAISGMVLRLDNAGTINGGSNAAINFQQPQGSSAFFPTLTNSGIIRSTNAVSTLANPPASYQITNSGSLLNTGSGTAVNAARVQITNAAGGVISSVSNAAIVAGESLNLTNSGTITGNIIVNAALGQQSSSSIDNRGGAIQGNVTFGGTNDLLVARYAGNSSFTTGISGTINGGGGTDTLEVVFAGIHTVSTRFTLPTGFERLGITTDTGATVTLAPTYTDSATIVIGGGGTLVNRGTIAAAGQVLVSGGSVLSPAIVNEGTLRTTTAIPNQFGIQLSSASSFTNTGTIGLAGDGVSLSQGAFTNSGTITAAGNALRVFGPRFSNSGTIRSTGGTAVDLSGSFGSDWSNSGTIAGATTGLVFGNSVFVNTGAISGTVTGVSLGFGGRLENRAGAVITGGTAAIAPSFAIANASVTNAGVINGNVSLVGQFPSATSFGRYFAEVGGVLNGNLTLGRSDALITELVNPGTGRFAGINGTVTANQSVLRYRVRADGSASFDTVAGFDDIGYELYNNARLVLTRSGVASTGLSLAGNGTVDINVDIATITTPAIQRQSLLAPGGFSSTPSQLAITSRGNLSLTRSDQNSFPFGVVALGSMDTFTNLGTITLRDMAATIFSPLVAIAGGNAVTNTGSISLSGGIGVRDARSFTNTGSLTQIAGGRAAQGVVNVASVTNSGTINVGGTAVELPSAGVLINSGSITSTGGTAVVGTTSARITNLAGATIAAAPGRTAIQMGGGQIINAGQIIGDVNMGFAQFGPSPSPGTYISRGGTLNGNLLFGSGSDLFFEVDGVRGVTGTINGGAGFDIYGYSRTSNGTVTLGAIPAVNFEAFAVEAFGSDTTVTINADAPLSTNIFVSGNGSIVNTASTTAGLTGLTNSGGFVSSNEVQLSSLTNSGTLGFVGLATRQLVNSGNVGTQALTNRIAIAVGATGSLNVENSGIVTTGGFASAMSLLGTELSTFRFVNSGTIRNGGVTASLAFLPDTADTIATIANSGTISSAVENRAALRIDQFNVAAAKLTLNNSGILEASGLGGAGLELNAQPTSSIALDLVNSGTIRANGGGQTFFGNRPSSLSGLAIGVLINAGHSTGSTITNTATGLIEASGAQSIALATFQHGLTLRNDGSITGAADNAPRAADAVVPLATAIQTFGEFTDTIVNTGRITGSINLAEGADTIVNTGLIDGNVFLGAGDDMFVQRASASLIGTVDAGTGTDAFVLDANGGGAVNGDQFINFESFTQTGSGDVTYSGLFRFDTIGITGGSATVLAGQTLRTNGPVTITGSASSERIFNNGTIAGGLSLLGGADVVINAGTIGGTVLLGDGDDTFVEITGSSAAAVDGGAGIDLYQVVLAGNRNGIGARSGFEQLALTGSGLLDLRLDQSFDVVQLLGTSLNAQLAGFAIGAVFGSDGNEALTLDGDIAFASMGGGNDTLSLGSVIAAGSYTGGAGNDALRFTAADAIVLTGSANGFEQIALRGDTLMVAGTLGAAGDAYSFGSGAQRLVVASGGTVAGAIDLGDGDDVFRLLAGANNQASVSGGAGTDLYSLNLNGDRTGIGARNGFEQLAIDGSGTLTLTLDQSFDVVQLFGTSLNARLAGFGIGAVFGSDANEGLTLDGDIALASLGAGNDSLTLGSATAGGSYSGGTGDDALRFSSTNPVVLTGSATGFEQIALGGNRLVVAGTLGAADDRLSFGAGAQQLLVAAGGTVAGAIDLGEGDDAFRLEAGAIQRGTINGGAGTDLYSIGLAGDRTGIGARSGFEQLAVDGIGTLTLTLDQNFQSIFLAGTGLNLTLGGFSVGTLIGSDAAEVVRIDGGVGAVSLAGGNDLLAIGTASAAGQYLGGAGADLLQFTANGPVTLSGVVDGFERILLGGNALTVTGTLANDGVIDFGAGDQDISIAGSGILFGQTDLRDGNDLLRIAAGARLGGSIAGGNGVDTIALTLDGNRSGIGQLTGFERLSLDGNGVLGLALTQSFETVSLSGVGLNLAVGGFTIGAINGTNAIERVAADGDLSNVALGGGDDLLMLGAARAAGVYSGGTGLDSLIFTATTPVTLAGVVTGFEQIGLAGGSLTVAGSLGGSGETIAFADGNKLLAIASGGRVTGTIDLGNGNDRLRLAETGVLAGTARGGAGIDTIILEQAGTRSISADQFTGFERLQTEGLGTLALASGSFVYERVDAAGSLSIARQASLLTRDLVFNQGDNQLTVDGGFIGSVDGGAGADRITVTGGSTSAPVMFGSIARVEAFTMNDGLATIANTASLGTVELVRGRLIGLAGSTIDASRISVGSNAIFGSAGTVNGNLSVSGILSPGASPGTMTVNGNVALGSGSLSVFEISPTISDRLVVNGSLSIASNATLQLTADQVIEPGRTIDLITTTGGVTGTFATIIKPATLFGFVAVRGGSVQLLGQFLNDTSFSPQVQRTIDYVNAVLVSGQSSAALRAALPQLINAQGVASTTGFSLVSAEAYASAQHIGIDQGLSVADAGRGQAFATNRTTPGLFTFASGLTSYGNLEAQAARGTAAARTTGFGFLGGIGYGSQASAFGVFGGYVDSTQQIGHIGARTEADGFVAGVHGRLTSGSFGLKATIAYNGSNGVTRRVVPSGRTDARFDLEGWIADVSAHYNVAMGDNWAVQPSVGMTAIRSTRGRATETGSTPFALNVAGDRQNAVFVDAGLNFSGGVEPDSMVKPYLSLGVRYQVQGEDTAALAGFAGSGQGLGLRLVSEGASRTPLRATAALGADVVLSPQLVLFGAASLEGGDADTRYGAQAGLRFAF